MKAIEIVKTTEVKILKVSSQNHNDLQRRRSGGIHIMQEYMDPQKMQHEPDPYKWEATYSQRLPDEPGAKP